MSDLDAMLDESGRAFIAKARARKPRVASDELAKPKRRRGNQEEAVSVAIRQAIRYALPSAFVFHLPNETDGSKNVRMHLLRRKQRGVVSGVPDLCVLWPGGGIAWLEVKAPGKTASDQQEHMHGVFRRQGQHVATVDSVDAALDALRAAGAPVRAR